MKLINTIKRWFSYFKVLNKVYDFDYSGILEVEKYQIKRVRDSINKAHYYEGYERDVAYMDLAIKLLNIVIKDSEAYLAKGCGYYINKEGELETLGKWVMPIYVNTKNADRFFKAPHLLATQPALYREQLRMEKAWNLYYKIRKYHTRKWWW